MITLAKLDCPGCIVNFQTSLSSEMAEKVEYLPPFKTRYAHRCATKCFQVYNGNNALVSSFYLTSRRSKKRGSIAKWQSIQQKWIGNSLFDFLFLLQKSR